MEIKKLLNEWMENEETSKLVKLFEKQDGEALDMRNVSNFTVKSNKLDALELAFEKNDERFVFKFADVSNFSIEQNKTLKQEHVSFCLRNGTETLNFVIVSNNNIIISFDFLHATLTHVSKNVSIEFKAE